MEGNSAMSHRIETDLTVRRTGRPAGAARVMLFLHGLTDCGSGWLGAETHWGPAYSLVTLDQRGHGTSPRFTEEQLAAHPGDVLVADAIGILEQLEAPPIVVGHSLGGAVALAAAVRRPELVRALVLEDPAPLGPGEEQRDPVRGADFLAGVEQSLAAVDDDALFGLRKAAHPEWPEDELLVTGHAEQQMDLRFLAHGDWKPSTRWPELFTRVSVPTLVLSGDDLGAVVVTDEVERAIDEIANPHVRFARIPAAAHCVRRENPPAFYDAVDTFLTAVA
jgi:pimeloyl-ACP methyl ester carboxylesterase